VLLKEIPRPLSISVSILRRFIVAYWHDDIVGDNILAPGDEFRLGHDEPVLHIYRLLSL
jgi:hypothetical protein